jgi:hypothetical protein
VKTVIRQEFGKTIVFLNQVQPPDLGNTPQQRISFVGNGQFCLLTKIAIEREIARHLEEEATKLYQRIEKLVTDVNRRKLTVVIKPLHDIEHATVGISLPG